MMKTYFVGADLVRLEVEEQTSLDGRHRMTEMTRQLKKMKKKSINMSTLTALIKYRMQ